MPEPEAIYWYEYDVLPIVGFVRAPDVASAQCAALDDATTRLRAYLADAEVKLSQIDIGMEVSRDATSTH